MSGEKTEQPTKKKMDDQRKAGQIPQRKNAVEAILLFSAVFLLWALLPMFAVYAMFGLRTAFDSIRLDFDNALNLSFLSFRDLMRLSLIYCGSVALVASFSGIMFNRFNFSLRSLSPNIQKLNPVNNIKSILSISTLYNIIRILVLFLSISFALYIVTSMHAKDIANMAVCGRLCVVGLISKLLILVFILIIVCVSIMAAIDYFSQSIMFKNNNKMSKDDIKREYKDQEGDALIKSMRRSNALSDGALPNLKDATHVIYSDEHIVAVVFFPETGGAPFVVAKAKGPKSVRLLDEFKRLKVPAFKLPSVALDFYFMAIPGQYLPPRSAAGVEKLHRTLSSSQRPEED
ncbi:EscU/YscU/HrcU family type III secretion system export apparatus switch protein [Ensifer sp. SL37]|uniref:EscU/YscU/HrcU family type III secretion system export apparatus switch protein n=1 Tax=Ensifer sp. SL37 TaxID=2995137 RepID=UPI0022768879|nr:EscU/YscU/HrcU family type III secretion system export apparatus switch protein [Ensifer sp. SL37]MCY1740505.1 EscU/YscU/HrcU family type III secretion system export apparatus switch protein [Ensifer sp. SL37]